MFQQSGIEINWITGVPYAWFLSLTRIFLSTTNLVATMLDMVVVGISRTVERHCWDSYGLIVRWDNDCIFYHANNLGRLLLSSSTVLIAVRNNKFGINLLIDSSRSSLYKFNAPWPLLALVGLLAPDQKIDLKIIGTHVSILLRSKLHGIINLKRSIWQIIIIQISLQIFSTKFTETTWNLTRDFLLEKLLN